MGSSSIFHFSCILGLSKCISEKCWMEKEHSCIYKQARLFFFQELMWSCLKKMEASPLNPYKGEVFQTAPNNSDKVVFCSADNYSASCINSSSEVH